MADYNLFAKITADSSGFAKGIKLAQSSLNYFSKGIADVTKSLMGLFALQNFGTFLKSIGNIATSFDNASSQIVKGTGATGKALEELSSSVTNAMRMGVGRSAEEIGTMIADLNTRFGVTGKELENLVDEFDMFASVTGQDTKVAIESVADVMLKWNVATEQTDDLLDQLTVASQMSGASVEELENGLKQGQTTFKQFGMSVTKSTAFLASLKKNGIDSGTALAGLRVALVNFTKDGKNAETAFKEISEQIKNASTESEALNIAIDTFGSRMGAEMVKVFRDGGQSVDEMAKALMGAKGALKESDEASRTTKDAFEDLKAVFTSMLDGMNGKGLRDFIDGISESLKRIDVTALQNSIKKFVSEFVTLARNIGTIIVTIFNNFKELFKRLAEMFGTSTLTFEDFKEGIYEILNNLYKIIQDAFNLIFALLDGDWPLAWEYAKLSVLRVVESIVDGLDQMTEKFRDKLTTILTVAQTVSFLLPPTMKAPLQTALTTLGLLTSRAIANHDALKNLIADTETNILNMTGDVADKELKELERVGGAREKYVRDFETGEIDIQSAESDTADSIDNTSNVISEWDKKLLEQKLKNLEKWQTAYRDTQIQIIEAERSSELDHEHSAEEVAKINEYYDNEIKEAFEENEEAKSKAVEETVKKIVGSFKEMAKSVTEVFKKVVTNITKVIKSGFNLLKKLVSINVDDILNTVLAFEDSVLTFFVETLPKIPNMIGSIIQSIQVLFQNLKANIKAETIADIIFSMLKQVTDSLPQLITDLLDILTEVINGAIDGIIRWIDSGGVKTLLSLLLKIQQTLEKIVTDNIDKIADAIASMLPDLVETLVQSIVSASQTLGKIAKTLLPLIAKIIVAIIDVITDDRVIEASIEAIEGIVEGLIPAIVELAVNAIPKIITMILVKLPSYTPNLIMGIVQGLADGFSKVNWGEALKGLWNGLVDFFSGIWDAIVDLFVEKIGGGFQKAFEHTEGTTTGSTAGDVALGIATGGISTIGHLFGWWADGTQNAPAGLSIVGESGPELVRFRGGEQVINARNTQKLLADTNGKTNNFNVTFNNLNDTSAYAMMNQLKQYNRAMAINGIL